MLKLQYFVHLFWRADLLEKDSDAGKDWREKEKVVEEDEMAKSLSITDSVDMNLSKLWRYASDRIKNGWKW